ncbi:hypothetical protein [Olsenella uli]|uniref:hypothetical protein n=1 Tax=Olsenella uli TaxID=133926 RepID=UPI0012AB5883|nr:hypothetical protein [Olsenella uli]
MSDTQQGRPAPNAGEQPQPTSRQGAASPAPQEGPGTTQPQPVPGPATPQQPVVESASATTSPDNKSGAAPYVIVGVALACLLFLAAGVGNLVGTFGSLALSQSRDYGSIGDLLDELDDGSGHDSQAPGNGSRRGRYSGTELTQDYVLSYNYQSLSESVSDYVFASDYAGAQEGVSTFVQALAKLDDEYLNQTVGHLRAAAAASDDQTRADELQKAADLCTQAQNAAGSLGVDESKISGSQAKAIVGDLTDARDDVAERWRNIGRIVALMEDPSGHRTGELADLDDSASDVTDIAIELTDALTTSAAHGK